MDFALLNGSLDGQGGSDTLDYTAYDAAVWVTISAAGASGYSGNEPGTASFSGIDLIVAAGADGDVIAGANLASTWALAASHTYAIDATGSSLDISGFDILQGGSAADVFSLTATANADLRGGSAADSFSIANGVALTGTVDGEAARHAQSHAYTTARSVILTSSNANGYSGTDGTTSGFAGIDTVVGGSGAGHAHGGRRGRHLDPGASKTYDDGTAVLTFSALETLQGGTGK